MPFHASSLAMVQSTEIWRTSPNWTHGRGKLRVCAARIFWVSVIGRGACAGTMERCYMHRVGTARNSCAPQVCWRGHGNLVRALELTGLALPRARGSERAHARRRGGDLRRASAALPGPARPDRGEARARAPLPAAGDGGAPQAGQASLDRRDAVRPRVPRAPHRAAGAGRGTRAEEARRAPLLAGAGPGEAALGDVAGPGAR